MLLKIILKLACSKIMFKKGATVFLTSLIKNNKSEYKNGAVGNVGKIVELN